MANKTKSVVRHGVALVTGGTLGIGRAVAEGLAGAGWDVALSYRRTSAQATRVCAGIRARGRRALAVRADVTAPAQVRRLFRTVRQRLGPVRVLVNNVGEYAEGPLASMSVEDWKAIFDSNLHSAFLCSMEALSDMRRRGWGRVINITASVSETQAPAPGAAAYHIAKQALLAFTRALASEEVGRGITINAVGPGLTDNAHLGARWVKIMTALSPLGRLVEPREVARAVVFLACTESEAITGAHLAVGGGWDMTGGGRPDASLERVISGRRRK
ncbi:MAG: SDR family oxidoreductase [Acidobacteriota bacterium]